jgi:predicted nuclease of predicted toxin-antitoxin system
LRTDGHSVDSVAEFAAGMADDAVLEWANRAGAVLLTADKDFGELVFRQRRIAAGVILVRLAGLSADAKAGLVSAVIRRHLDEWRDRFSVIEPGAVRLRPRAHP